jgi:NADH-quinone oxidoreductase subunit E
MGEKSAVGVAAVVDRYGGDADMLIPMMQDVQAECGYLPQEELRALARALGVPLSRIYGIATFYASFRLMPKGEHTIQLCMGTACFIKGAEKISRAIQEEFGLVAGGTTVDGKFTFAPVNCLGACALAPVMVVDGRYHGGLTTDSAVDLLRRVAESGPAAETAEAAPAGGGSAGAEPEAAAEAGKRAARATTKVRKKTKTAKTTKPKKGTGGKKK